MDNPWSNVWGDDKNVSGSFNNAWAPPANGDQEADLGQPSWSTGSAVSWNNPLTTQVSLWNPELTSDAPVWPASSYDDIQIGKSITSEPENTLKLTSSAPSKRGSSPPSPIPGSPVLPVSHPAVAFIPASNEAASFSPPISTPVPPDSPNGFGTFETAGETQIISTSFDPWTPAEAVLASDDIQGSDAWNTPWDSGSQEAEEVDDADEWERTRKEKAKRDRHVVSPLHTC